LFHVVIDEFTTFAQLLYHQDSVSVSLVANFSVVFVVVCKLLSLNEGKTREGSS